MPTFPVWSALQAHIKDTHPPTCPYPECTGRTFKSGQRLRDHLKVHEQQDADLVQVDASEDMIVPPVLAEGLGTSRRARRKRRYSDVVADDNEPIPESPRKLPRIVDGEAGKDWTCGHPGCGKAYKTRFARDEHAQAAHSRARHKCETCGRVYRRLVSLRRHLKEGWCAHGGQPDAIPEENEGSADEHVGKEGAGGEKKKEKEDQDVGGLFTGSIALPGGALHRRWGCPFHPEDYNDEEDDDDDEEQEEACGERFHRVYDVRRHLSAAHGIDVDDMGTREMLLADGQTGEEE